MNLTHLSFQRAPRLSRVMPAAPTNTDRRRAYLMAMAKRAKAAGNDYPWNFGSRLAVRAAK